MTGRLSSSEVHAIAQGWRNYQALKRHMDEFARLWTPRPSYPPGFVTEESHRRHDWCQELVRIVPETVSSDQMESWVQGARRAAIAMLLDPPGEIASEDLFNYIALSKPSSSATDLRRLFGSGRPNWQRWLIAAGAGASVLVVILAPVPLFGITDRTAITILDLIALAGAVVAARLVLNRV